VFVDLSVPRNRLFALAVSPNVVAAASPQETPPAVREPALQIATLHAVKCTPLGVRLFLPREVAPCGRPAQQANPADARLLRGSCRPTASAGLVARQSRAQLISRSLGRPGCRDRLRLSLI